MRVVSLNGAAFIFFQRGERLKENEGLAHNKFLNHRYVIWAREDAWDVRVKVHQFGTVSWKPIAESLFSGEDEAWQAALAHHNDSPTIPTTSSCSNNTHNNFAAISRMNILGCYL